jgi:L-alanine-DL-glutamate epimerase-like enolase superfamily enzyme
VSAVCEPSQTAFVVRIVTDEGVGGIGEGSSIPSVLEAIYAAPVSNSIGMGPREPLLGQDPLQIEPLVQRLLDHTLYLGGAGARLTAISAAEITLWDLKGKAYGAPVSELLGGRYRERLLGERTLPARRAGAGHPAGCDRRGRHRHLEAHRAECGAAGRLVRASRVQHRHRLGRLPALLANSPREHMVEWSMEGSPLNTDLTTPRPQMVDGFVDVPNAPGLGIGLDWDVVNRYRVR